MSAQTRWAVAQSESLARFRAKFHMQRAEFESVAKKQASASLNIKTLEANNNIQYHVSSASRTLLDLRDLYRNETRNIGGKVGNNASEYLLEAKQIVQQLPRYVLEDDPELKSTLRIIRACSTFGFHPKQERALTEIIDLVKRSAYAIEPPKAIQFLSALQVFNPRPDDDIRAILENVSDGIRMGSNDLLVHEVSTLLSAMLRLEKAHNNNNTATTSNNNKSNHSRNNSMVIPSQKALLDSLTRHLVTYHSTAPINDVCRAAAFLTKLACHHGRVLLHEIQPRIAKEASNLTIPPQAALDLLTAFGSVEPEDSINNNNIVQFPRNYELDADVAAPASLSASTRPIYKPFLLATTCETLMTHANLLSADDVADAFSALKQADYHHEALVDRLISRAMTILQFQKNGQQQQRGQSLVSMIRILEGVNHFVLVKPSTSSTSSSMMTKGGALPEEEEDDASGVAMLFDLYGKSIAANFGGGNRHLLSFGSVVTILNVFADGKQFNTSRHAKLYLHCLELLSGGKEGNKSYKGIADALLVRALEVVVLRLELFSNGDGETALKKTAVRAIRGVVQELFVNRGGLPSHAEQAIETTEKIVEKMLPQAENGDAALLDAIKPLVE